MENQYALMAMGFVNALSPMNIVIMIASVTMGIIIGCMPGLSAAMGVPCCCLSLLAWSLLRASSCWGASTAEPSSADPFPLS